MKTILYRNLNIIMPHATPAVLPSGCIGVLGDIIHYVGSEPHDTSSYDRVVDMDGKYVLPGMINAHHHLYSSLAIGMPFPEKPLKNFVEILENIWWKLDRALDQVSIRASFETGLMESLRHGVTTVIDHHSSQTHIAGSTELLVEVARHMGVRIATAFEITDRNGPDVFRQALNENTHAIEKYSSEKDVSPLLGLHASFTLSDESLKTIRRRQVELGEPGIHIHVAEDAADHHDAVKRGYPSVIRRLSDFQLLNSRSLIIHGITMQEDDLKIVEDTGAMLVHCPSSNANNRVGMLPTETIQHLSAGLGTDGMQGNILSEVKEGTLIRSSHLKGGEPGVDYLQLVFSNNPRIASRMFGETIGEIRIGAPADLVFYDYHPRTELHAGNWKGHVLFGFGTPSDVMTAGEFRIRNHEFQDPIFERIPAFARKQSIELWNRTMKIDQEKK